MSDEPEFLPVDRESPIGEPVIRGDSAVTGDRAQEAVAFDPDDPESLAEAADVVRSFAEDTVGTEDNIYMLRGAAACAALVRGEGSYTAAAERAGGAASISFIRKWARVHDLPRAIRRQVAMGVLAPTAAKHIARLGGDARFQVAWATLDSSLTVREVREVVSAITNGATVEDALAEHGVTLGEVTVRLDADVYREVRRLAAREDTDLDRVVSQALREQFRER
jgi:hypothetical protein